MPIKKEEEFWELPPLAPEDQKLLAAYIQIGKPVDQLPYTPEFDELVKVLGLGENREVKNTLFQRLLQLRKKGRLPRLTRAASELL